MAMAWAKILPVVVSICIIILVAVLREYSRTVAAIAATMPLNIPLGMWLIYSAAEDQQAAMTEFTSAILINIIPTLFFMVIAWQGARSGWKLLPTIGAGYTAWALILGATFLLRRFLT